MTRAALQSRPSEAPKPGRPRTAEGETAIAGAPVFLGGTARGAAGPAFLQRAPQDGAAHIAGEEELPVDGVVQRLPQDPFPGNGEDDDEGEDGAAIQPKLEINRPGDAFEAEADRVADAVTSGAPAAPAHAAAPRGRPPAIQRACPACGNAGVENEEEMCPDCAAKVQRAPSGAGSGGGGTSAADAVARPGAGRPLPPATRGPIEAHLGADLSGVRVHSDSSAQQAAGSIGAKAFTHGNHIWLGRGQSADDLGLMAHEATHTVQQGKGRAGPALIQRAPADHQHPEDAAAPRGRIEGEIEDEIGDEDPPDRNAPRPRIDPAEKRAKAAPMEGEARPDVDRPAQEAPKVEQAAGEVQAEADQPGDPGIDGQSDAPDASAAPEGGEGAAPAPPISHVEAATAQIASLPVPEAPRPVAPPPIARPVDADGQPIPPEGRSEALIIAAAAQLQMAREAAFALRQKARQQRANAILLRGNVGMADAHIAESEQGLTTAHGAMETRREVIAEAGNAHATSEEKAAKVEAEAPGIQSEAEEAQDESGPMATEASDTAAENAANTPDDPDAAAKSAESGGQMNSVAGDSASMDQASTATAQRAEQLQADAASARQQNATALAQIEATRASADQTDAKLAEMDGQTAQARSQVEPLKGTPDAAEAQARALDDQAAAADARTEGFAADLTAIQRDFMRDMAGVPGATTMAERNAGAIQRTEGDPAPAAPAEAPTAYAPPGYEGRNKVELPTFQMGPPLTEQQRQERAEAAARAEARRRARIDALQNGSRGNFAELSATDKAGIALDFMLEDAFAKAGNIKWPDFSAESAGRALLNVIDPRGPLNGISGGLSTVASGVLNLFDMNQWQRDPLGNLLKSAADIATGITVILGSIVALLGVIVAISAAVIVLTLGWASPVLGPVIAWCTSAGMTVGGWTISVGLLALYYQGLLIIKNIVDVMTAETAEELVVNTEQMESDFSQVGEIGMQMGTAYLGAKGGPGMLDDIATNGIRTVARQEVVEGLKGAALEYAAGEDLSGVIGAARMAHGVASHARGGGGGGEGGTPHGEAEGGAAPRGEAEAGAAPRPEGEAAAPRPEADTSAPEAPSPSREAPPAPRETGAEVAPPSATAPEAAGTPAPRPAEGPEPTPAVEMDTRPPPAPEPGEGPARPGEETRPEAGSGQVTGPEAPAAEPSAGQRQEAARPEINPEGPVAPRLDEGGASSRGGAEAGSPAPRPTEEGGAAHPSEEGGPARPEDQSDARPRPDAEADPAALRDSSARKSMDEMSPAERRAEAEQANTGPREPIDNPALRDAGFDDVTHLDNGMDYVRSAEHGAACRVANNACVVTGPGQRIDPDAPPAPQPVEDGLNAATGHGPDAEGTTPGAPEAATDTGADTPPPGGADAEAPSPTARPAEGEAEGDTARTGEDAGIAADLDAADRSGPQDANTGADSGQPEGPAATATLGDTPADALPARTGDTNADVVALEGRPVDGDLTTRMEAEGYIPVRNADGDVTAFRRPNGNPGNLPAVHVSGGRVVSVRPEVVVIPMTGHGRNRATLTVDPRTNRPISIEATLHDDAGGHTRGDNATEVGNTHGTAGDDGGHLVAHRFMSDTIDQGIVPQAANLNRGAWKTMENEIAGWIAYGRSRGSQIEITMRVRVDPPGQARPDRFEGGFTVVEVMPDGTRHVRREATIDMANTPGQTFDRVYFDTDPSGRMSERR